MKKAILAIAATLSFLMGCSFTHTPPPPKESRQNKSERDIFDLIKYGDVDEILVKIRQYPPDELTKMTKNSKTLLEVALERGSREVYDGLLSAGITPYFSYKNKPSIYATLGYDSSLFVKSRSFKGKSTQDLITDTTNYRAACDQVLQFLLTSPDIQVGSVYEYISHVSSCSESLLRENVRSIYSLAFNAYLKNKINFQDMAGLLDALPQEYTYDLFYSPLIEVNTEFVMAVHPFVILIILQKSFPEKINPLIEKFQLKINDNTPMIVTLNLEKDHQLQVVESLFRFKENQESYFDLHSKIIEEFSPLENDNSKEGDL